MTEDAAIAAAKRQAPLSATQVTVGWVRVTHNPFAADFAQAPLVWVVNLQGSFGIPSCDPEVERPEFAPSLPPCLWKEEGLVAVLDHFTGQLIGWTY